MAEECKVEGVAGAMKIEPCQICKSGAVLQEVKGKGYRVKCVEGCLYTGFSSTAATAVVSWNVGRDLYLNREFYGCCRDCLHFEPEDFQKGICKFEPTNNARRNEFHSNDDGCGRYHARGQYIEGVIKKIGRK